jgi:uncharacterized protein (DUF849 family)
MVADTPLIITAGLTGSRISKQQTPGIPIAPDGIARSGIEAWRTGASAETNAILCLTASGIPGRDLSIEDRLAPLALRPDMASFDAGSINTKAGVLLNDAELLDAAAGARSTAPSPRRPRRSGCLDSTSLGAAGPSSTMLPGQRCHTAFDG